MAVDVHREARFFFAGAPLSSARGAVVLVHGRGASAASLLTLAPELAAPGPDSQGLAFLAPQAVGGSWYPASFLAPFEVNGAALESSLGVLDRCFEQLAEAGFSPERTALLGFSQGACLSLEFAARRARRYGAVVGWTGGLVGPPGTPRAYAGSLAGTPVLLSTGDPDPHVPLWRVEETAEVLRGLGAEVELVVERGRPHTVTASEVERARQLLVGLTARS